MELSSYGYGLGHMALGHTEPCGRCQGTGTGGVAPLLVPCRDCKGAKVITAVKGA